jgi:hypothetical protein
MTNGSLCGKTSLAYRHGVVSTYVNHKSAFHPAIKAESNPVCNQTHVALIRIMNLRS